MKTSWTTDVSARSLAGAGLSALLLFGCGPEAEVPPAEAPPEPLPERPTWSEHVAPVLFENCVTCHRPGGAGPFSMLSYATTLPRAEKMAEATAERRMPPWLPDPIQVDFANERRLDDRTIELIRRWAEAGAPEGDPALAPEPPEFSGGWTLGEPDLVVEMSEAYVVPGHAEEEFRNFVIPSGVSEPRWVRAVELLPGNPRVVHHATVRVDSTDSSRLEDARDPAPGFDEMFTVSEARPPGGFFLGWTPGLVPTENPEGTAWRLTPGTDFVVQLHLRPTANDEPVRSRVGVWFTDRPPTREPLIIRLGSQDMDIPPGEASYRVQDSFRLPVEVQALGVYPHAHYLGKRMEVWAERANGERTDLLRISDWDFNWQDAYHYRTPVSLPRGSVIHMRFTYDNSAANPQNPSDPPRRVVYGPSSVDEMAELWLQVVPRNRADLATLQLELQRKQAGDRIEGWQHMLSVDPNDAHANLGLGNMHQSLGEWEEARDRYERALAGEPGHPQAHYNLGLVLEAMGDTAGAASEFREAIRYYPDYADALNNLGIFQARRGQAAQAEASFLRAVEADSLHADALNNLGNMLRERGAYEEAIRRYDVALRVRPTSPLPYLNRSLALLEIGRSDDAIASFREGVPYFQDPQPLLTMAWALSTHSQAPRRRGEEAVRMAAAANQMTGGQVPVVLDVLAAALAAAGRFSEAVQVSEQALALARAAGNDEWVARIEPHLESFRDRRVWVER